MQVGSFLAELQKDCFKGSPEKNKNDSGNMIGRGTYAAYIIYLEMFPKFFCCHFSFKEILKIERSQILRILVTVPSTYSLIFLPLPSVGHNASKISLYRDPSCAACCTSPHFRSISFDSAVTFHHQLVLGLWDYFSSLGSIFIVIFQIAEVNKQFSLVILSIASMPPHCSESSP